MGAKVEISKEAKAVIKKLRKLTNEDDLRAIRDESVRQFRREITGRNFKLNEFVNKSLNNVLYYNEFRVEHDLDGKKTESLKVSDVEMIAGVIDEKADKADFHTAGISLDVLDIPSMLHEGFAMFFMRGRIREQITHLSHKEALYSEGKDKPSLVGAMTSYCIAKEKDVFDFCRMALEIIDTVPNNGDESRRREHHRALLKVDQIRYVLKHEKEYKEIFEMGTFFDGPQYLVASVGSTSFFFERETDMKMKEISYKKAEKILGSEKVKEYKDEYSDILR